MTNYPELVERLVVEDPMIGSFLSIGLGSYELGRYLRDRVIPNVHLDYEQSFFACVREKIPKIDANLIFKEIGGKYRSVRGTYNFRRNSFRVNYPGKYIFYLGSMKGLARPVHEIRNVKNLPDSSCVGILNHIDKIGKPIRKSQMPPTPSDLTRRINTLLKWDLIDLEIDRYGLTSLAKEIFSQETQDTWHRLREWEPYYTPILETISPPNP